MPVQLFAPPVFHAMTKPAGPLCNLDCSYCFYLEKVRLFPEARPFRMSDEVLERYVRHYIESQQSSTVTFAWQGGEPTVLGVDFFRKAVALQQRHSGGKTIENTFQTNGTLLDDEWGKFFRDHAFLVGISIDGPREMHDAYRVDKGRGPTHDRVMAGLEILRKHQVEFNILTTVHPRNARSPLEVYRFLKRTGCRHFQFIPIVRQAPGNQPGVATEWSVSARDYGKFLTTIFDEWVSRDVGRYFIQIFEVTLGAWVGERPGLCVFAPTCGDAVAVEHNGDVFSCDHFVFPGHRLGNLMEQDFGEMVGSPQQRSFSNAKSSTLPKVCRECDVRFACNGGCPKDRFALAPDGEPGLNQLCGGYQSFFRHVRPAMEEMASLFQQGRPVREILKKRKGKKRR